MPRHSTPHEHVAATDPGPPDPPGVHVALGSEQCNGMGCAARTGLPCAYVDRRGRACPTAWCPSHRLVFQDAVYCTLHGTAVSGMHSEYGEAAHPDLDNPLPAMITWISRAAEDDIVDILQGICRDRGEVLVGDPVRMVLLGTPRRPTWERAWKTCSSVGVGARVAIAVEEEQPREALIKVNSQVIARLTAPEDDDLAAEPTPEVVELLVRQLVLLITMYLHQWLEDTRTEARAEAKAQAEASAEATAEARANAQAYAEADAATAAEQPTDETILMGERARNQITGRASSATWHEAPTGDT
jgi:hypothetical protein